jgi:hypothetical protein
MYSESPNAIPEGAIKLKKQLDNIGTVFLFHHHNKTDIYLNYSIGMKIEKPRILRIDVSNNVISIDVRRPTKGVVNKVNYHIFKIELDIKIEEVHLMEFV